MLRPVVPRHSDPFPELRHPADHERKHDRLEGEEPAVHKGQILVERVPRHLEKHGERLLATRT